MAMAKQASLCLALWLVCCQVSSGASCNSCNRSLGDALDSDFSLSLVQRAAAHRQEERRNTSVASKANSSELPTSEGAVVEAAEDLEQALDGGQPRSNLVSCAAAFCVMYAVGCGLVATYYRADVAILFLWLGSAAFFYIAAGNDPVTTVYALVEIVTTVGYGDFTPTSDMGKVAMTVIVFFAAVVIAGVISELIDFLSNENLELVMSAMKRAEAALEAGEKSPIRYDKVPGGMRKLISSLSLFLFFLVAGTIFYAKVESCSCSFGKIRVEGCVPELCASTGGYQKSWVDALYFSVITLSTVGFGDYAAVTWWGQLFGIFWMLFGVAAMVNFVTSSAAFIQSLKQEEKEKHITKSLFDKFDADHSGTLDKLEFLTMQIQLNSLVEPDVIDSIMKQFDLMDASKDGHISREELKNYYHVKELED